MILARPCADMLLTMFDDAKAPPTFCRPAKPTRQLSLF